jgi:hypothetical protein
MQKYTQNQTGPQRPDSVIGTPDEAAARFPGQQSYPDTCAIRCQEYVLEQFTGQDFDEDALVEEARIYGWYAEGGGTAPQDMGNLLEMHGVPVTHYENATSFDLANELAQGHKIMISVDSSELWNGSPEDKVSDFAGIDGSDHAVVVSGIDTSDPDNPQVIISDPGTGQGDAHYPMDQFLDAWQDGSNYMVATDTPAPPSVPGMENFDYAAGHISYVAEMPYEEFTTYGNDPEGFNQHLNETVSYGSNANINYSSSDGDPESVVPEGGEDPEAEAQELIHQADALIEQNDALIKDLKDENLDTYGH